MSEQSEQDEEMLQNVTKCNENEDASTGLKVDQKLHPKQVKALELMVNYGLTNQEIADEVDVHRATVSRWRNQNDQFRKALRYRLKEYRRESMDRLQSLTQELVDVVLEHVQGLKVDPSSRESFESAMSLLKNMGLFEAMETSGEPADELHDKDEQFALENAFEGGEATLQQLEDLQNFFKAYTSMDDEARREVYEKLQDVSDLSRENTFWLSEGGDNEA